MKTMNIIRLLLLGVVLFSGANGMRAEAIWTGTANSTFSIDKEKFADITTNDKIQITVSGLNIYYWSLGVALDGNTNNTANLVSNWKGESYGYQTNSNNNLVDDSYLELELNDDGVDAIKANGLTLKDHNGITITSVSIVSGDSPVIVKYVLTYVVDGKTVKTERLEAGATPTPPDDPTKEHYTFAGWKDLPETMPEENVTVTAEFTPNMHTITYYINNVVYDSQQVAYGTAIVPITPTLTGYKFNGWEWYPETMPDNDIDIKGSSSKLYGLSLVYDEKFGTVTAGKTDNIEQNEQITVTVTPAEGYEVASIVFTDATGTAVSYWGNYTVQFGTSDITCTVRFREAAAVVYNIWNGTVQGGTVTANPTTAVAGETVTLTLAPYSNYVLATLNVRDQSNGSIELKDNQFVMPASNVWIDATFVDPIELLPKHTLTIVVDNQTTTMEVAEGTALSASLPIPVKSGYNFTGWAGLPEDGNMPDEDLIVTAQFAIKYYASIFVGVTGYSTFCSAWSLYFQGDESIKAFIARAKSATEVTLTQVVGSVAAGTGLVLIGEEGYATADVEIVETGRAFDKNLLVGVLGDDFTANAANQYVLVEKSGEVKFADTAGNAATVTAGKAYLQAPSSSSRLLTISFDDETTAIKVINAGRDDNNSAAYNLNGQRVNSPKAGLYFVNGKKVIVK